MAGSHWRSVHRRRIVTNPPNLGTGLGFSSVSPWSNIGASASTVRAGAIIWLIFAQIVAFAMGGYLAGRLRTKWVDIHTDEVYFRDTAHGLLVWAVGVVLMAAFLASAAAMFAGRAAQRPEPSQATATEASLLNPNEYLSRHAFPVQWFHDGSECNYVAGRGG